MVYKHNWCRPRLELVRSSYLFADHNFHLTALQLDADSHLPGCLKPPKFRGSVLDPDRLKDRGEGLRSGRGDLRPIWLLS